MDTPHDTHGTDIRIVAGIDDSAGARAALTWAVRQAAATGGSVTAVAAWHETVQTSARGAHTHHSFRDRAAARVREATSAVPGAVDVVMHVEKGHPGEVLVRRSAEAGLLVLGRHTGLGGVGSIAGHCLRHASCPVVLVPAGP